MKIEDLSLSFKNVMPTIIVIIDLSGVKLQTLHDRLDFKK